MAMDAKPVAGQARRDDLSHHAADLGGKGAAIGVTQHDPARASVMGGLQAGQRIGGVGAIAVKEMLGIQHRLAALGDDMGDAGADVFKVLLKADAKGGRHMKIMRLAHQADRRGAGVEDGGQHIVILRAATGAFGHAKGGHRGAGLRGGGEELAVGRVGARPAALDIINAQRIQRQRDLPLVTGRELDALGLLTIAQGGVEKVKSLAHRWPLANSFEGICNFLRRKLPGIFENPGVI